MAETLILQKNEKPTIFNKEMMTGFLIGFPFVGILFGIIGGLIGKSRIQDEALHGKRVYSSSSIYNQDAAIGGILGLEAGIAVATMLTAAPIVAALAFIAITVTGFLVGGQSGKKTQELEYAEALQQQAHAAISITPQKKMEIENTTTPSKSFTATLENERALAASAQKQI